MGKIKEWVKNHENVIIGGAIGGLCAGVGAYIGWKYGFGAGVKQGATAGAHYVPVKALLDSGFISEEDLSKGGQYIMDLVQYDSNPDILIPALDESIKGLRDLGADVEKTALVAVSLVPDTH